MFRIPLSVKAAGAFVTGLAISGLQAVTHAPVSPGVTGAIASAVGFGAAIAIPEGARYIDKWLKDRDIPVSIDIVARAKAHVKR